MLFSLHLTLLVFRQRGFPAACPLTPSSVEKCPLKTENELKKDGLGAMSEEGILIARWFDNKVTTMGTNHYSAEPVSQVSLLPVNAYW
jgi:hypothetical protein